VKRYKLRSVREGVEPFLIEYNEKLYRNEFQEKKEGFLALKKELEVVPDFLRWNVSCINVRGGLKELVSLLHEWENKGIIDHVPDKQAAELFTVNGKEVNPDSLKKTRNDLYGQPREISQAKK
jgi:hypothetical protein